MAETPSEGIASAAQMSKAFASLNLGGPLKRSRRSSSESSQVRPSKKRDIEKAPIANERPRNLHLLITGFDHAAAWSSVSYGRHENFHHMEKSEGVKSDVVIRTIRNWPAVDATPLPSALSYNSNQNAKVRFGYEALQDHPGRNYIAKFFKSLLRDCPETSHQNSKLNELAQRLGKNATDFLIDFLKCVKDFLDKFFEEKFGADVMAVTEVLYTISAPPSLSTSDLRKFVQHCISAGFEKDQLRLGSELEAMLHACVVKNIIQFLVDMIILLIDAGGLTIDVGSYRIRIHKDSSLPPTIEEICVSEGVIGSGLLISENLANVVKPELRLVFTDEVLVEEICEVIMKHFEETFKDSFTGSEDFYVSTKLVPGLLRVKTGGLAKICIKSDQMRKEVFDPIIDSIKDLVQRQEEAIKEHVKEQIDRKILFCGGVSQNPYIRQALEQHFLPKSYNFAVVPYKKEMISQGLVIMGGLQDDKHISRLTIGVETEVDVGGEGIKAVRWLIIYGQEIVESFCGFYDSCQSADLSANIHGECFKQNFYVSDCLIPDAPYTRLEDIPKYVKAERIVQEWRVDASVFPDSFNEARSLTYHDPHFNATKYVFKVRIDYKVDGFNSMNPSLHFTATTVATPDCPESRVLPWGEENEHISLKFKPKWSLELAGTLGTRAPHSTLTSMPASDNVFGKLHMAVLEDLNYDLVKEEEEETEAKAEGNENGVDEWDQEYKNFIGSGSDEEFDYDDEEEGDDAEYGGYGAADTVMNDGDEEEGGDAEYGGYGATDTMMNDGDEEEG